MQTDFDIFFRDYGDLFNRALAGQLVLDEIRAVFTESFIAAGPSGVRCGANDASFTETLEDGYAFYREIGTKRMSVLGIEPTPIDDAHAMVKVFWQADYEKPDGQALQIGFDVTYLMQTSGARPLIFAFVAGDEMALFRRHGLVPEEAAPAQANAA